LLVLVACATGDRSASASPELREWRTAAGKPPSKNEFAAVVAACEDKAKRSDNTDPIEDCLADYGLRRAR
jgi:hypothetical protein